MTISGVVSSVVILVAELVSFVQTCIDSQQIFYHSDCIFTIEEFSVNVVYFKIFHLSLWQDSFW